MSENMTNGGFNVPPDQDFDTISFQGSMQQILQENIGNYVLVDFLIGTDSLVRKQGILYNVASQFLVLYDDFDRQYVVCDIFSVKFVTFLLPGQRPAQNQPAQQPAADAAATQDAALRTPARAAYSYATRHNAPASRR